MMRILPSGKFLRNVETGVIHQYFPGAPYTLCGRSTTQEAFRDIHPNDIDAAHICFECEREAAQ